MKFNRMLYDKKYDILYYRICNTSNSYGDELNEHLVLLRDMDTEIVTGVTIIGYSRFFKNDNKERQLLSRFIKLPENI